MPLWFYVLIYNLLDRKWEHKLFWTASNKYTVNLMCFWTQVKCVSFEVLTTVKLRSLVFWDVTLSHHTSGCEHLTGTFNHHLLEFMGLEPHQIKVTHSFRASEAGYLATQRYIPEDQNLSKFDLLLSFRNRLGTVRDNYFVCQVVWFSVLRCVEYIVCNAGKVSLCQFFYLKALRKLSGRLVASRLAIKLLTLILKAYSVCQHFLWYQCVCLWLDCPHLFKQDLSL